VAVADHGQRQGVRPVVVAVLVGAEHLELEARRAPQPPVGLGEAADEDLLGGVGGGEPRLPGFQERVEGARILVVEHDPAIGGEAVLDGVPRRAGLALGDLGPRDLAPFCRAATARGESGVSMGTLAVGCRFPILLHAIQGCKSALKGVAVAVFIVGEDAAVALAAPGDVVGVSSGSVCAIGSVRCGGRGRKSLQSVSCPRYLHMKALQDTRAPTFFPSITHFTLGAARGQFFISPDTRPMIRGTIFPWRADRHDEAPTPGWRGNAGG
jgi:hypothetical protein